MDKQDIIKAFKEGSTIRMTMGVYNSPKERGRIAKSEEEILKFYESAEAIDAYFNDLENLIDVKGATYCDMF